MYLRTLARDVSVSSSPFFPSSTFRHLFDRAHRPHNHGPTAPDAVLPPTLRAPAILSSPAPSAQLGQESEETKTGGIATCMRAYEMRRYHVPVPFRWVRVNLDRHARESIPSCTKYWTQHFRKR
jgi:hypothetical protein